MSVFYVTSAVVSVFCVTTVAVSVFHVTTAAVSVFHVTTAAVSVFHVTTAALSVFHVTTADAVSGSMLEGILCLVSMLQLLFYLDLCFNCYCPWIHFTTAVVHRIHVTTADISGIHVTDASIATKVPRINVIMDSIVTAVSGIHVLKQLLLYLGSLLQLLLFWIHVTTSLLSLDPLHTAAPVHIGYMLQLLL